MTVQIYNHLSFLGAYFRLLVFYASILKLFSFNGFQNSAELRWASDEGELRMQLVKGLDLSLILVSDLQKAP